MSSCGTNRDKEPAQNAEIWIGSAGTSWTDVLSNIDGLLLHERVVDIIENEGLSGFQAHPVKIKKIESARLAALPVPKYYLIEITGRVDVDPEELDDEGGSVCPLCFYRIPKKSNPYRWSPKRLVPKLETWDRSDFVTVGNLRNAQGFCSKRFIDLACEHKWTNFIFGEALPGIAMWENPPKAGLSYKDAEWFEKVSNRVQAKHADLFE